MTVLQSIRQPQGGHICGITSVRYKMNIITRNIPNAITSLNLLSGIAGILCVFSGRLDISFLLMIAAAIFDFFDGLAARALGAYSPMGKELDSLADSVSFGLLPALMLHKLMLKVEITQLMDRIVMQKEIAI